MNKKQFLGFVTVAVIIGGTIYCIKKYKESEQTDGEVITLAEARDIVKAGEPPRQRYSEEEVDELIRNAKLKSAPINDLDDIQSDARAEAAITSFEQSRLTDEEIEALKDEAREVTDYNAGFGVYNIKEEDNTLRHDPNSLEARGQFLCMELAEWADGDYTKERMFYIFNQPFIPKTQTDSNTHSQIQDYKREFFGGGRWVEEITIGDLIMHYARMTDYNVGRGVRYWVEHFLEVSDLEDSTPEQTVEIVDALNEHRYYSEAQDLYGLFGLTEFQIEDARDFALRSIDRTLTFDIQYNVFLQGV